MKPVYYLFMLFAFVAVSSSCNRIDYRKTKSGLVYKIIPSSGKDSALKNGDWLKINFIQKLNDDSVLNDTHGKMPYYQKITADPNISYDPSEIFPLMKNGDSAVVIMFIDSLIRKNPTMQLPPFLKKGDKLNLYFKIIEVFHNDSIQRADAMAEYQKDQPRQQKEREAQVEKMKSDMKAQREKDLEEAESSGEAAKERKAIEDYLTAHHISAQKTGKGTYVQIIQQGAGEQAAVDKYINVKYTGKSLDSGKVFQTGSYAFQLGRGNVIDGWDEGMLLFKEGGKGILYIPGYRAYGSNPSPNSPFKPNEALIFEVELLKVSDTEIPQSGGQ
jgi:FKBP-type peptidyl-prolyl cis-trans isomerase FkpA